MNHWQCQSSGILTQVVLRQCILAICILRWNNKTLQHKPKNIKEKSNLKHLITKSHSKRELEIYLHLFANLWIRPPSFINYHFRCARFTIVRNCSNRWCQDNLFYGWRFGTWPKNIQCPLHRRINQFCLMKIKSDLSSKVLLNIISWPQFFILNNMPTK